MEGFLRTDEAADLLGVAPKTLYYYLRDHEKNGFPQPQRFNRALLWEREPLLAWRQKHPPRSRKKDG